MTVANLCPGQLVVPRDGVFDAKLYRDIVWDERLQGWKLIDFVGWLTSLGGTGLLVSCCSYRKGFDHTTYGVLVLVGGRLCWTWERYLEAR